MNLVHKLLFISLLLAPLSIVLKGHGSSLAFAQEEGDNVDGEDDGTVDDEGVLKTAEEDEDGIGVMKASADADVFFLFTKPVGLGLELPAGRDVQFLVGFANKGKKDFIVDAMDASFRYAMDFNFHLQNFSTIGYNQVVKPEQETTMSYQFFVSEAYSARPYGLTVNLYYRDLEGKQFIQAVFNETVTIVELDEGLDGETFFLYVFLVALVVLMLVGIQQFISSKSRSSGPKSKVERGTANENDVDYDWLPKETLQSLNPSKSPKAAKIRQSPRQRVVKRRTGAADD